MIIHVVACGSNREIGKDNGLLWRLPDDLKYFKAVTTGQTIVMGRKTFESIGRALPNRRNIVVTSNREFSAPDVEVWHDLDRILTARDTEDFLVIGGATLYEQTMPVTERFYITEVDGTFEADTYYPLTPQNLIVTDERFHPKDERHDYSFTFRQYDKKDIE
ncbi:dihydrofolate reductase [Exiguobacterium sp. SH3S2]|uniref:dihydrofolate reductase n=1 Tax=unclassified Exiguobacterium TaxID=2644629 RepID=UPI00103DA0E4|nr:MULTISPECIES: dihydrofolate reductase [unclassified Exiguobacterium]TCI24089.1 dihydrofolate reductase [Exiguobacterium sp. SH5S4]TCI45663.1 dihydrofolate reductase [Exiguobacterium sp. SH3S3]TCI56676.1 dihydrofolate reductase [Exiguobacterium sp. SH5S13]TCI58711.1 dihydrofolate reductase [Exiguobacterium sp. SH3S1]TCI60872.1 dihydrofolate reductase [Exiguobacterium sp. SH3S2]